MLEPSVRARKGDFCGASWSGEICSMELAEDLLVSVALSERVLGALSDLGVPDDRRTNALAVAMTNLSGFVTAEFPISLKSERLERRKALLVRLPDHAYPQLTAAKAVLIDALAAKSAEGQTQGEKRASAHAAFVIAGLKSFAASADKPAIELHDM